MRIGARIRWKNRTYAIATLHSTICALGKFIRKSREDGDNELNGSEVDGDESNGNISDEEDVGIDVPVDGAVVVVVDWGGFDGDDDPSTPSDDDDDDDDDDDG